MPEISPIRPQALGDQVASELRRLIITGRYAPGTLLVESHLAAQFDLSRGPIRDALKILAAEGSSIPTAAAPQLWGSAGPTSTNCSLCGRR